MEKAKVSVIVPVYNSEIYLPICIESIQRQTYRNLEILLIDDGSVDNSLQICEAYAANDNRIRVIHQENCGVSAARNKGLNSMSGEYFSFVDSDDELNENAIEILVRDILDYKADMASAVKSIVHPNGRISNTYENHERCLYTGLDMLKLSLEGERQTNSVCAKLFGSTAFQHIRFADGRSINEDGFFLFQCYALMPTVVQYNKSIYLYYVRKGSNSRNVFTEKYFDMLFFCEKKKEIIYRDYPELAGKLITMEVSTHLFFLEVLCRTNDKKYQNAQRDSIQIVKKNYKSFYCMNKHEREMARIVVCGLYPLYKWAVRFKYYR